jgi:hypothetical protein
MLDDPHHGCLDMGHIVLQRHQITSPALALLPSILPSYHCYNHILSALVSHQLRVSPDKESSNAELFG